MTTQDFKIVNLSDRPELADVCATWSFGEWGCQNPGASLEDSLKRYRERTTNQTAPLWLALSDKNKPMAMAGLKDHDHPDRKDLTPWLTSVFVHPYYRHKGVASKLITYIEQRSVSLFGHGVLYLYSSDDGEELYEKLGWKDIGRVRDLAGLNSGGKILMQKELSHV